jgi:hypothetical protein
MGENMPTRARILMEMCRRETDTFGRLAALKNASGVAVFAIACALSTSAKAQVPMSEGVKGWTYYISINQLGHVATAEEACTRTAKNHMGTKLRYMRAGTTTKPSQKCFYPHFLVVGGVRNFFDTRFIWDSGYSAKSPGVCVKWPEGPRPPSCSPDGFGFAVGNPVAVASGAKIQTETDISGSPNGALRITRRESR